MKQNMKNAIGLSLKRYNETYMKATNDRIDNIVAQSGTDNTEIVDARIDSAGVTHTTLNNRILAETKMNDEQLVTYTGNYISAEDTTQGYLKNIEILGNTIQDEEDLADIRSVGDKVEGQELYKIPVLSCGKNLFNGKWEIGDINITTGENANASQHIRGVDYIKILPNTTVVSDTIFNLYEYRSDKSFIKRVPLIKKATISSETHYIRVLIGNFTDTTKEFQLEEGTVATPYEPYQEDKITILSPTPLEKVGDVADRIICKDGVWGVEKNVYRIDDIPSKTIRKGTVGVNTVRFEITESNLTDTKPLICNKSKWKHVSEDTEHCFQDNVKIVIYVNKISLETEDVEGFKKWAKDLYFLNITSQPQFIPLPHDQQVKLRTFANKTNISFLTEIEGTIKAQVPKSLGATVNTHTEQIGNLNKELDRVKKLEESTVSTVETGSDFTTVEATSNGYFEDVKLEGKTLVNLWDINSILKSGQTVVKNNRITITTTNNIYSNFFYEQKSKFKPLTEYTIIVDIYKNTLQTNDTIFITSYSGASSASRDIFATNGGTQFSVKGGIVGRIVKKYTTISDFSEVTYSMRSFVANNSQTEGGELELAITVLEGDHTQNPPNGYIEGLKSVGQDVDEIVVSSVKGDGNLFRIEDFKISSGDGVINQNSGTYTTMINKDNHARIKIKVKPNTEYIVNCDAQGRPFQWRFRDINQVMISPLVSPYDTNTIHTINTGNNEYIYVELFQRVIDSSYSITFSNIYIGKSSGYSQYTPHQSDKKRLLFYNEETQTWEKPVLREWDSIEKHSNGKYYYHQRSGEVVLNGSENWNMNPPGDNAIRFVLNDVNNIKYSEIIATIPTYMDNNSFTTNLVSFGICSRNNNTGFNFHIEKSKLPTQDVAGFKQWLQANNKTVVYQLAEEKVYECTNIDLITYEGETNYIVECGAISPKSTLKVHNNISNVVSLLQKKVSLLESNITKYMITQNRMQLASTYSADSVTFKVDYFSLSNEEESYNEDLYNLILNNILVGKDNYNYDKMFTMVLDYASWNQISWEQFDILVGLMDIQHNPPIEEIPTDDEIVEEIPNEIM